MEKLSLKQLTKLHDLRILVAKYGYWSKEVNEFNNGLDYSTRVKINKIAKNE